MAQWGEPSWLILDGIIGLMGGGLASLHLQEITRRQRWLTLAASLLIPVTMAPGMTVVLGWPDAAQAMLACLLGVGGRSMVLLLVQADQLLPMLRLLVARR
ncbi:MAG: hypothetical protein MRY63_06445 [Neomegalonema sp.]|nr:hypothetical protein [Neomegalonema sp.]